MRPQLRIYSIVICIFISIFLICSGAWFEHFVIEKGIFVGNKMFGSPFFLFFSAINFNVLLLLLFLFLAFRSGVKLVVAKTKGVFGSKLNTKLVTAFLFFSILPTITLLYISTKFVNINFQTWLPNMLSPSAMMTHTEFDFTRANEGIRILKISYFSMLVVISLLIIFSATWLGVTIAREITTPMQVLAQATESVAQGNYHIKIDDIVSDDEMGTLARSFRSMISDLKLEKERVDHFSHALKAKAEELFRKSEYNEFLLKNINAAVISVNENMMIKSWNYMAEKLFNYAENDVLNKHIHLVFEKVFSDSGSSLIPSLLQVMESKKNTALEWSGKIGKNEYQLQIALNSISSPSSPLGKVILINDITELARAQRLAAWREVATRVAHEIKNPLTPIKLGTERLERKFLGKLEPIDKKVFQESVQIILHSTESIKQMVNEFVQFARMPHSILIKGNIIEPIYMAYTAFLGHHDHSELKFIIQDKVQIIVNERSQISLLPKIYAKFDKNQIIRLFINLIQNAVSVSSHVFIVVETLPLISNVRIHIIDEGPGLSKEARERIFEPHFSTKKTGMGLGLTIVKQIVDEHAGQIYILDNSPKGTNFVVEFETV